MKVIKREEGRGKREEKALKKFKESQVIIGRFLVFSLLSSFLLLPSLCASADDIRDVKPPVSVPGSPWFLWIVLLALAVIIFFLFRYWQRNKARFSKLVIPKAPWETAHERLQDLKRRDLFAHGKSKEYFIELSAITRQYIEGRFDIHAPEMTTEEFLNSVKATPLIETKHKEILKSFLVLCDMVKFAQYGPDAEEAGKSFELVQRFVDETKVEAKNVENKQFV